MLGELFSLLIGLVIGILIGYVGRGSIKTLIKKGEDATKKL